MNSDRARDREPLLKRKSPTLFPATPSKFINSRSPSSRRYCPRHHGQFRDAECRRSDRQHVGSQVRIGHANGSSVWAGGERCLRGMLRGNGGSLGDEAGATVVGSFVAPTGPEGVSTDGYFRGCRGGCCRMFAGYDDAVLHRHH